VDELLAQARSTIDPAQRVPIYRKVVDLYMTDAPQVIVYNYAWLWGLSRQVNGFVANKDGLIRLQGVRLE